MVYKIFVTRAALDMMKDVQKNVRDKMKYQIGELSDEPEKKGKPCWGELKGLLSTHVAGRYRIVYRIREQTVEILAAAIRKKGDKKDIYQLTKKLIRAKLI